MSTFDNKSLKMLLLNPQLHINVLLKKLLNKIVILSVNKFVFAPLMITLVIPHMKYMYHKLTIHVNIIQGNMGNNI